LAELIRNVQASEKLYNNIDISFKTDYRLTNQEHAIESAFRHFTTTRRWVNQGDFTRVEWSQRGIDLTGNEITCNQLTTYDGVKTRIRKDDVVNVRDGRHVKLIHAFRPHTALLEHAFVHVPLSVFLEGSAAVKNHPEAGFYSDWDIVTTVLGYDILQGKRVLQVKITCQNRKDPGQTDSYFLWIDQEKNYIPVQRYGFAELLSKTIPATTCRVTDWKEVEPGIWVPMGFSRKTIDSSEFVRTGKVVLSNEDETKVESVTLEPTHDTSFFSNFHYNEDDVYYEVNPAGRITKGGILKSIERPASSFQGAFSWLTLGLLLAAVCFLILGGYLYKKF